jgi:hypothetical protein
MHGIGPNNGRGRPRGATGLIQREFKECWHLFLNSDEYRDNAKRRILSGRAPHLESYLLNRIYGKPQEQVAVTIQPEDLSALSTAELAERAADLLSQLKEAEALEAAFPAEFRPAESTRSEPYGE